jgi:hypothetical protein
MRKKKWTQEVQIAAIKKVMEYHKIDTMPTVAQMKDVKTIEIDGLETTGSNLANVVANTGGVKSWAKALNIRLK